MRPYGKKSRLDGTDTRIIAQSTGTETCLLYGAKCTGKDSFFARNLNYIVHDQTDHDVTFPVQILILILIDPSTTI